MASRKRKPDSPQIGLSFGGPSLQTPTVESREDCATHDVIAELRRVPEQESADLDLESFDDYDDTAVHEEVPRLRLVDPPQEVRVIVEANRDGFWVSRLRHSGTTVASVQWTRSELEELIGRAQAALEVG